MIDKVLQEDVLPPAITCPLIGMHLIEASAGTGKTWTLTGILLRLLIERNTPPERIVATTFTKAAASEMQARLHSRLYEFYVLCRWLKTTLTKYPLYTMTHTQRQQFFKENISNAHALDDPINVHLLLYVLDHHPSFLDKTVRRLSLLMLSMDKLFVGTLDSLTQKWLSEFGAEMGIHEKPTIVVDTDELYEEILHDELRAIHSHIYHNMPVLYRHLFLPFADKSPKCNLTMFSDIQGTAKRLANVGHFLTAPIDTVKGFDELNDGVFDVLTVQLNDILKDSDWEKFAPYWQVGGLKQLGINGNKHRTLLGNFHLLPNILESLKAQGLFAFGGLDKSAIDLLNCLIDVQVLVFNKDFETKKAQWHALPLGQLAALATLHKQYHELTEQFQTAITYHLASTLRQKLANRLDQNKQSTFGKQMHDLATALQGQKGQALARHIRHLYPVALIDEVQDINGEQMALLKQLYFDTAAQQDIFSPNKNNRGFVLCVGDPKQAIYRFRGGDVVNYNALTQVGLNNSLNLTVNRRSNRGLIEVLNALFVGDASTFGQGIVYHNITAFKTHHRPNWLSHLNTPLSPRHTLPAFLPDSPMALLKFEQGIGEDDQIALVAQHINSVLQTGTLSDEQGNVRSLLPADIMVLGGHKKLAKLKKALQLYDIASMTAKSESVFASWACQALYSLCCAILSDDDETLGAMLSELFLLPLANIGQILTNEQQRLRLITYLNALQERYTAMGIGACLLQAFLSWSFADWYDDRLDKMNLWQYLARFDHADRNLTDLWQLMTLFCDGAFAPPNCPLSQFVVILKQKMTTLTDDESSSVLTLPSQSAVSLMTIHRSKGLESPVVYVLGLSDKGVADKTALYPYVLDGERHLSPNSKDDWHDYQQLNKCELFEERKRLGYVAVTRASEQLFIIADDKSNAIRQPFDKSILHAWGFYGERGEDNRITVPDHLRGRVCMLTMSTLTSTLIQTPYAPNAQQPITIEYPAWESVFAKTFFVGRHRTSFTNLFYLFDKNADLPKSLPLSPDVADYVLLENETEDELVPSMSGQDGNAIRHDFLKGADAGTFLHKVLEHIDSDNKGTIGELVHRTAKSLKLPTIYQLPQEQDNATNRHYELVDWLYDVACTPLVSGARLARLPKNKRKSEFAFMLGAKNEWQTQTLTDIFLQYSNRPILPFIKNRRWFDFLSGEMDLLYEYQGKYYIVDYKSNFLATHWQQYDATTMSNAMTNHGYWLQAVIYQLALHRLLKLRKKSYIGNEKAYLGEVEYLFLRGIKPLNNQLVEQDFLKYKKTGSMVWDIPLDLILALDKVI